ncbi:MAG: WecB/TagA/CpsF family glycosyltransferase [Gammaproteobacteria bacterium]|nr:WecB/TagA/CpsF family glycosyltransferase [Gammaproteobacteria bacterium]MBU1481745.1 WecB/TagA/CpsF family glycosyltransferase [Gammaproteobacteria bacterium]
MAATTDLGPQSAPVSLTYGGTYIAPQNQFYDEFLFSIETNTVDSITSTINLGSLLGINNLQTRLYSGTVTTTGVPDGLLQAWSTPIPISGAGYDGMIAVISPITLGAGSYVLEVRGDVVGTYGGSYSGVLNISPVPEIAEWMLLIAGLGFMAFVTTRRRRLAEQEAGELSGMYGIYREGAKVLDSFIHALSWEETLARITVWAKARESRYICICNVHSVVTATQDEEFKQVLRHSDMATPDGMPIALMLRKLGFAGQERINGPDLMWKYCAQAERSGEAVYFYGSSFETLRRMSVKLQAAFPKLQIGGAYSPPFRAEGEAEEDAIIASINASGAGVVFVGLGCPKQEKWMAAHHHRIHAVLIGVGAAFDYHAGTVQRAPLWMQRNGLEWSYRLFSDPRRLWKRYLVTNTLFIVRASLQLLQHALRNVYLPRTASRHPAMIYGQQENASGRVQA